jgi:hypothetical protein
MHLYRLLDFQAELFPDITRKCSLDQHKTSRLCKKQYKCNIALLPDPSLQSTGYSVSGSFFNGIFRQLLVDTGGLC